MLKVFIGCLFLVNSVISFGQSQKKIKGMVKTIEIIHDDLLSQEKAQRKILGSLYSINQKVKKMSMRRSRMNDEVLVAQNDVEVLAKTIAQMEISVESQKKSLSMRLRLMYRMSRDYLLQVLFESKDGNHIDRTLKYLKLISEKDKKLIKNYKKNIKALKTKRHDLLSRVRRLVRLKKRLKSQEGLLTLQQENKVKFLQDLRKVHIAQAKKMQGLKNRTKRLLTRKQNNNYSSLLKTSFYEKKGRLNLPVSSGPSRRFGITQDPTYMFKLSHKGFFYSVKTGQIVSVCFGGRVDFSGYIPGYGNTIIVQHGDNYSSIYSGLGEALVGFGEKLIEGQVIGKSGYSQLEKKDGIYFEIRHFTEAIDPEEWLYGSVNVASH